MGFFDDIGDIAKDAVDKTGSGLKTATDKTLGGLKQAGGFIATNAGPLSGALGELFAGFGLGFAGPGEQAAAPNWIDQWFPIILIVGGGGLLLFFLFKKFSASQ